VLESQITYILYVEKHKRGASVENANFDDEQFVWENWNVCSTCPLWPEDLAAALSAGTQVTFIHFYGHKTYEMKG